MAASRAWLLVLTPYTHPFRHDVCVITGGCRMFAHTAEMSKITMNPSLHDLTQRNVELIAKMEKAAQAHKNAGEVLADWIAAWVGSWTFLITQTVIIIIWMSVNVLAWWLHWDPYPFILLNLLLSFQAAYATPIILMSQNRQARIDERRNHLDLQINLLSEQENTE